MKHCFTCAANCNKLKVPEFRRHDCDEAKAIQQNIWRCGVKPPHLHIQGTVVLISQRRGKKRAL